MFTLSPHCPPPPPLSLSTFISFSICFTISSCLLLSAHSFFPLCSQSACPHCSPSVFVSFPHHVQLPQPILVYCILAMRASSSSSMPLQEITNTLAKFRLHVDLDREYATLRSSRLSNNMPNALHQLRMQGCKAIDLWTDGSLYPMDPISGAPPTFRNITMLLRFIGDGFNGMLGYCIRLHSLFLDETRKRLHVETLYQQLQTKYAEDVNKLNHKVADLIEQQKVQLKESKERLRSFFRITDNYVHLQHSTRNMRRRIDHLTHLPLGFQARKRKRQSVDLLASNSGARKRRLRATRFIFYFITLLLVFKHTSCY